MRERRVAMVGAATSTRLYFHIPLEIVSRKEKLLGAFGREITGSIRRK